MKILILVTTLTQGGAERVASLWANGFDSCGHNVSVCTCRSDDSYDTYQLNINIQRYNIYNTLLHKKKFFNFLPKVYRLRHIIKKIVPDVIICVQGHWAKWAYYATIGIKIPIINTEHNSFDRPKNLPLPRRTRLEKYIINKRYAAVTVLTEADKKCIKGSLKNVFVLPNPLTYEPQNNVPSKEKIILAAGRLDVWDIKGFDILIKAWGKIALQNPEWKLYIAGTGKTENIQYLNKLAKECNVDNRIVFPGYVEMQPLYQKSSVFVLSSRCEGFGMVLTEAMSQGCACIACDYRGRQSEIITSEKEGIICPVDDENALARAIDKLINNETMLKTLQRGALARSHFFRLDKIIERWDEILTKIVKQQ